MWLAAGLVLLAAVYALADRATGVATFRQLRVEVRDARARVAAQRDRAAALRAEVRELETDPFAIERAIREDLDLARPGEVILRFPAASSTP